MNFSKSLYFTLTLLSISQCCVAQVSPKVYGVFIYSFAKHLQWPSEQESSDFVIGVIDHSALKDELERALIGKQLIDAKKIVVREISNVSDVASCKIIFLSKSQSQLLAKILEAFPVSPVLIISEMEGQAEKGSGISFVTTSGKLGFEFNLFAIETRGIKMPGNLKLLGVQVNKGN
jgi:hypothetical protein